MWRPPLLLLYPQFLHSTSHGHLLRPLRRHHSTFPPPPRRFHRLPTIRHLTTTPTTTTPSLFTLLRRLAPSIPTLTLLTLSYLLYSLTYTIMPVTGSSMSPLLNASSPDRDVSKHRRRDWVWVEMWPRSLIRFADARLNPVTSPHHHHYSASSASAATSYDNNEATATAAAAVSQWWLRSSTWTMMMYGRSCGLISRGVVVALYSPTSCAPAEDGGGAPRLLVKRVVALPGDVVQPRPGARYPRRTVLVPEGCVWVEGDNEVGERSWDSNFFGPVGVGMVVGRVGGRVWPLDHWGRLDEGEVGCGWWPGRERVVEGGGVKVRRWSGGDAGGEGDVG